MKHPHAKLNEVADFVAEAIGECLNANFHVAGKALSPDEDAEFEIVQFNTEHPVKFTLSISDEDVDRMFCG